MLKKERRKQKKNVNREKRQKISQIRELTDSSDYEDNNPWKTLNKNPRACELDRAITSTFTHGFQNNFAQVFSLRSSSAI